jgi:hypothetical protein
VLTLDVAGDVDVGLDDAAMLLEPEPHIPVNPDVASMPEVVVTPEVADMADDVDIPDGIDVPDDIDGLPRGCRGGRRSGSGGRSAAVICRGRSERSLRRSRNGRTRRAAACVGNSNRARQPTGNRPAFPFIVTAQRGKIVSAVSPSSSFR